MRKFILFLGCMSFCIIASYIIGNLIAITLGKELHHCQIYELIKLTIAYGSSLFIAVFGIIHLVDEIEKRRNFMEDFDKF